MLDLSKVLMQEFHHNFIKSKYGNKANILLTGTHSLIYKIEAKNVYEDLYNDNELFNLVITQKFQNIKIIKIT